MRAYNWIVRIESLKMGVHTICNKMFKIALTATLFHKFYTLCVIQVMMRRVWSYLWGFFKLAVQCSPRTCSFFFKFYAFRNYDLVHSGDLNMNGKMNRCYFGESSHYTVYMAWKVQLIWYWTHCRDIVATSVCVCVL